MAIMPLPVMVDLFRFTVRFCSRHIIINNLNFTIMYTEKFYNFTKNFVESDKKALIRNASNYINASKNGSLCCIVKSVSKSGMSRKLLFFSVDQNSEGDCMPYYYGYFLELLGYKSSRNYSDSCITVQGCGMDMIFYTNYKVINQLFEFGFITEKERDVLSQKTPHTL